MWHLHETMSRLWRCPTARSLRRIASARGRSGWRGLGSAVARESDDEAEGRSAPSDRVQRLAEDISTLSLLEVSDLTALLRRKLGLPEGMVGMVPVGMVRGMGMGVAGAAAQEETPVEKEKTSFDVKLERFDAGSKIKVIKEVRAFTELGLKEAKELVEKAPVVLKAGVGKEEAEQIIQKLKSVGAAALME